MSLTLGSLFDGAGTIPFAAQLCGITPIWSSEIEKFPCAVTAKRFPNMKQLGDITKINGREIEPVDIIAGGSPCVDVSVAGKKYDLLSPVYGIDGIFRNGCWFCPKQCLADLWSLWKNYPNLYNRLLEMEPYSGTTFRPRGGTLAKCAERFESGHIPKRRKKAKKFVQLNMFDKIDGGDKK